MTVVYFAKVSTLYPWVVISSLAKRLEKLPFCPEITTCYYKGYYESYAKLCQGRTQYHSIAKVSWGSHGTTTPLAPYEPGRGTMPTSHSSEQGTHPIASLIIKQAISYQTRGGTCCPGVSTPMTRSLADSTMTNHKLWRSQPSPPFQTMLKPQHRISPLSPHITTDGRPTLSTLNTSQT
jgi:hypothetical protein